MRVKIPPVLHFLLIFGLSLLSLIGAFALSWSGKDSASSFLVASTLFATLASTSAAGGKAISQRWMSLIRQVKA